MNKASLLKQLENIPDHAELYWWSPAEGCTPLDVIVFNEIDDSVNMAYEIEDIPFGKVNTLEVYPAYNIESKIAIEDIPFGKVNTLEVYPAYNIESKIAIEVAPDKWNEDVMKSISKLTTYLAHSNGARYVILESMRYITSKKQDNFNGLTDDDFNNLLSKPGLAHLEQLGYSVRNATPHITRVSNTEVGWYKHYYNRNT